MFSNNFETNFVESLLISSAEQKKRISSSPIKSGRFNFLNKNSNNSFNVLLGFIYISSVSPVVILNIIFFNLILSQ